MSITDQEDGGWKLRVREMIRQLKRAFVSALDPLQKIATIFAVILAGGWSLYLFMMQREFSYRANTSIETELIGVSADYSILVVKVHFSNVGSRAIDLSKKIISVDLLSPTSPRVLSNMKEDGSLKREMIDDRLIWFPSACGSIERDDAIELFVEPGETEDLVSEFLVRNEWRAIRTRAQVTGIDGKKLWRWENIAYDSVTNEYDSNTDIAPFASNPLDGEFVDCRQQ